jgi:ankyrin repeat protein
MSAVKANKPKAMQQLLLFGANAWLGDNSGCTALHYAAWQNQVAAVELLLQHAEDQQTMTGGPGLTR